MGGSTRRILGSVVAAVVAGATLPLLVASAAAAVDAEITCGATITQSTTLTRDLVDCPHHGLVIGADGVRLDLDGHTIDGTGEGVGVLSVGFDGVVVGGGDVREFIDGIGVLDAEGVRVHDVRLLEHHHVGVYVEDAERVRIERNRVVGADGAIFVGRSSDVVIEGNHTSHTGAGVYIAEAPGARVSRNVVDQAGFVGVLVESAGALVSGNRISVVGLGVIVFADAATVAGNQITDVVGCVTVGGDCVGPPAGECPDCIEGIGISIEGGAGNVVQANEVRRTRAEGIRVAVFDPGSPTSGTVVRRNTIGQAGTDGVAIPVFEAPTEGDVVEENVVTRASDDGIDVDTPFATLRRNTANRNGDLGIEAVPGVTDGGGNVASRNGNPLQCTGVHCRR